MRIEIESTDPTVTDGMRYYCERLLSFSLEPWAAEISRVRLCLSLLSDAAGMLRHESRILVSFDESTGIELQRLGNDPLTALERAAEAATRAARKRTGSHARRALVSA
jgi:hypothetical protein